jgi:hypothetical protein
VTVPASAQEQAIPVDGSILEIRIGSGDSVIGFWLRWRCVSSDESVDRLSLPAGFNVAATPSGINPATPIAPPAKPSIRPSDTPVQFSLVYLLADENAPQTVLAPFYMFTQEDSAIFYPASKYSIILNIMPSPSDNGMTLSADVSGGSKNYRYSWARWSPDSVAEEGVIVFGDGANAEIGPGVHNVVLRLEDTESLVVVQVESVFYVPSK